MIVGRDPRHIAFGYNGFPRGIADTEERLNDRAIKHQLIQHAERNALDNAAFDLEGSALVTTMFPCSACTKSIIQKGVRLVISPPPVEYSPWAEDAKLSLDLFSEAGVEVRIVPAKKE